MSRPFLEQPVKSGKMARLGEIDVQETADGLITDHPAPAREVLRQHAQLGRAGRIVFELAYLLGAEPRFDPI